MRIILTALMLWTAAMGLANRTHTNTFAPCAPETLQRNSEVLNWEVVPRDVRANVAAQIAACGGRDAPRRRYLLRDAGEDRTETVGGL